MASITAYGSKQSHLFTLTVDETGTSQSGNYSTVNFSFTIYKSSYSWNSWSTYITYTVTINGNQYTGYIPAYSAGSVMTITSGSLTVPHDSNGYKTLYFSFSVTDNTGQTYTCGNASASGSMNLTYISRYPSMPLLSEYAISTTYATIYWSTDMVCDAVWYTANGGTTWTYIYNPNTSSGRFTLTQITPNTTRSIKVRVRGKESQLTTDSGTLTFTTLDIPRISTMDAVVHGEPIKFTVTAPANNSGITLQMLVDTDIIFTRSAQKGSNSIELSDSELDTLYGLYGNSNTVSATFNLTANNDYAADTYVDTRSETVTLKGNQKTAYDKVSGSWKRGKIWTKVSGNWVRGVLWTKVDGTWKRGV